MNKATWTKRAAIAAGGVVIASAIAAPAFAEEYPPPVEPTATPGTTSGATSAQGETPAYTGSGATIFGLMAGIAALGVGGGLVVASRRKKA